MALDINVGGVSYDFDAQSFYVSDVINERSTSTFTLITGSDAVVEKGLPVRITDGDTAIFAGFVDSATKGNAGGYTFHFVRCVDMHYLAAKRVCAKSYADKTAGYCVKDIATTYLKEEGVYIESPNGIFARTTVAYNDDGSQAGVGVARCGVNGIMVEEGTTNLVTNPFFTGTYVDGVAPSYTKHRTAATWSESTAHCIYGNKTQRVVSPGGVGNMNPGVFQGIYGLTIGQQYTVTFKWYMASGASYVAVTHNGVEYDSYSNYSTIVGQNTWSMTFTAAATGAIVYFVSGWEQAADFYVQAVQVENKAYATSITDGARAAESLKVPTANALYPGEGTIEMLVYVTPGLKASGAYRHLWNSAVAPNRMYVFHDTAQDWFVFETRDDSGVSSGAYWQTAVSLGWHRFAFRWSSAGLVIFVDGVKGNVASATHLPLAVNDYLFLGCATDLTHNSNATIRDVIVSNRARTDEELESRGVLTTIGPDGDTTIYLPLTSDINGVCYIMDGVTLQEASFNYIPCSDALQKLAERSGYWWCISPERVLYFCPRDNVPSDWAVVDYTDLIKGSVKVTSGNKQYRTREIITGGVDVTSMRTERIYGDGLNRSYAMGYNINHFDSVYTRRPMYGNTHTTDKTVSPSFQYNGPLSIVLKFNTATASMATSSTKIFEHRNSESEYISVGTNAGGTTDGRITFQTDNTHTLASAANALKTDGTGMTVVATYAPGSPGTAKLYVDNVMTQETDNVTRTYVSGPVTISHRYALDTYTFLGNFWEAAYFSRVLTAAEVALITEYSVEALGSLQDLLLWYKFDEGTGSTIVDHSGNARSGTMAGVWFTGDSTVAVKQKLGTRGETGSSFYWSKGSPLLVQDSVLQPLNTYSWIVSKYYGEYPMVSLVRNDSEITALAAKEGVGTGIVDHVTNEPSINGSAKAIEYGSNLLDTYSTIGTRLTFNTSKWGLFAGETTTVNLPTDGLENVAMLVYQCDTKLASDNVTVVRTFTLSDLKSDENWIRTFQNIKAGNIIRENLREGEVLAQSFNVEQASWAWNDTGTPGTSTATVVKVSTGTHPSPNIYPG